MFPWADGDSLRDFWNNTPREAPNSYILEHTILQLRGIADALDRLHNFDGGRAELENGVNGLTIRLNDSNAVESHLSHGSDAGSDNGLDSEVDDYKNAEHAESIRHGDLKPENILRFLGNRSKLDLGTLKIADMGLAKRHVVATQERWKATSTRYGTRRYEAPETVTGENARSRLYDIWSMGCITFEFIVWILYGNDELSNFYKQIEGNTQQICQYYEVLDASEPESARVHPTVLKWMDHVQTKDPECSAGRDSATKDLLKIVRDMLLVVNLPPNRKSGTMRGRPLLPPALGQSIAHYRATAAQFRDALDRILGKRDVPGYIFTGKDRTNVRTPTFTAPMLSPNSASLPLSNLQPSGPLKSGVLGRPIGTDYTLPPLKDWEFQIDNSFADKVVDTVGMQAFMPQADINHQLCTLCSTRNFLKGGFSIEEQVSTLEDRAPKCDLCRMLYEIHSQAEDPKGDRARFQRDQSSIIMTGDSYPVLSLVRSPNMDLPCPIQVGFPELPEAGSDAFFSIIKLWLEDCDTEHTGCQGLSQSLPTRLLDVGTFDAPTLRLVETKLEHISSKQYIALSHPWGDTTKYTPFCTIPENLANHLYAIPENDLPATFRDAVRCTRRIGIRYLWVDSLCIIQGEFGDFNDESKKMEAVFSGAYCVLAASRASNQQDGFLGRRPQREYITIQRGNRKTFFVCKTIDNFSKDVIEGSLNKRGWVLQERALARRTIYFTKNQSYFECGQGVRCETLTRLHK
jgi:serine/threonine protein kinase